MKLATANAIRSKYMDILMDFMRGNEEDIGEISSNVFNFPIVTDDGEEGWVEVSIKVPKGTKDEEYDGYSRRESYQMLCEEKELKRQKKEAEKAKKIAKQKEKKGE